MRAHRHSGRALATGLLLAALWLAPGPALAQSWHRLGLSAPPLALCLEGEAGWALTWEPGAGAAALMPLSFPSDGIPSVGAPAQSFFSSSPPALGCGGGVVLVADGGATLRRFDGNTWSTVAAGGTFGWSVADVALDPGGSGWGVAALSPGITGTYELSVSEDGGASWASLDLPASEPYGRVAVAGAAALATPAVPTEPVVQLALPASFSVVDLYPELIRPEPRPGGGFLLHGAGVWAWTAGGSVQRLDDPQGRRLAQALERGGAVLALSEAGQLIERAAVDAPWAQALSSPTGLSSGACLASPDPARVLVGGVDASGGALRWRNRSPAISSGPADLALAEGEAATLSFAATDPDGELPSATWRCDPPAQAPAPTFSGPTEAPTVSLPLDAAFCPSEGPEKITCELRVQDLAGASQRWPFVVSASALDPVGPALSALGLSASPVEEGAPVTASLSATDDCPAGVEWSLLDASGAQVDGATLAFGAGWSFSAPSLSPPGVAQRFTVRAVAGDEGGNTAAAEAPLDVLPRPVPTAEWVACPASHARGQPLQLEVAPAPGSATITGWRWSLSSGRCAAGGDGAPTCAVEIPRCGPAAPLTVTVIPLAGAEEGAPVVCELALEAVPTAPSAAWVGGDALRTLVLEGDPASLAVEAALDDCADEALTLSWGLEGFPPGVTLVAPAESPAGGLGPRGALATLTVAAKEQLALDGAEGALTLAVTDPRGAAAPPLTLPIRLAFPQGDPAQAGLRLVLEAPGRHQAALGELIKVEGQLESDLGAPLQGLEVALALRGFAWVEGSLALSDPGGCGVVGEALPAGPGLRAENLRAGCPLGLSFWLRRAPGTAALTPARCVVGPSAAPVARCDGGFTAPPRGLLGCQSAGGLSGLAWALAIGAAFRRRLW